MDVSSSGNMQIFNPSSKALEKMRQTSLPDTLSFNEQIASSKLVLKDRVEGRLPKVSYSAQKFLLNQSVTRGIKAEEASSFQKLIASLALPAINLNRELLTRNRQEFFKSDAIAERICIKTVDGISLDTMQILNPSQLDVPPEEQRWLLFFNGNGIAYENNLNNLQTLSEDLGINMYTGNYRGVGYSEGYPQGGKDLVLDGFAMLQYLLNKGILPKNILLHGWSLGGAVALKIASFYSVNLCHDRSFSKIENVIENLLPAGISTLAAKGLKFSAWSFGDLAKIYESLKGKKFIIYSPEDGIIKPPASMHHALGKNILNAILITNQHFLNMNVNQPLSSAYIPNETQQYYHNVPITKCGEQYQEYIKMVKKILNLS